MLHDEVSTLCRLYYRGGGVGVCIVVHHAVLQGETCRVGGVDGGAGCGGVVLEDAVCGGYGCALTDEHTRTVLQRGGACGVAVDDVEAVEHYPCSRLYGDYVVEAVLKGRAAGVAVELRAVVEGVALRGGVGLYFFRISAHYAQLSVVGHGENVERGGLWVFVDKGVTRPQVAFEHADFKIGNIFKTSPTGLLVSIIKYGN